MPRLTRAARWRPRAAAQTGLNEANEMAKTVVIVGAGGKMGIRAAGKIGTHSQFNVLMCESNPEHAAGLVDAGFTVTPFDEAVAEADFIILAVPDAIIGKISEAAAPKMKSGGMLVMLDAAAAYIGELPQRTDIGMMITHPCHPPFFTEQPTPEARADYFGGIAKQDILVSLIQGSEETFAEGTELCRAIFSPVGKAHRVTPEQFAFLEPSMAELITATAATLSKQSMDAAIEKGVPREAAEAFMAGHAQIALAIVFGAEKSPFSDAAQMAVEWGMKEIIRPDWRKVYERETLEEAIHFMLKPKEIATNV
ncbi:MAG TPA: phosphogluconate dehydrogenase C-terminal domain-containing protein [Bryobacteraceae bacterium]|nr:phosphogluconate dehydrogenase C-terminal domain-containing protein [Bryobacteraceae bacterium]